MTDRINQYNPPGADAPATDAFTPTLSDTNNEHTQFRGIYVGTGGNVSVYTVSGTTAVFKNVPGGTILPIVGQRVNAAGTTASDLLVLI